MSIEIKNIDSLLFDMDGTLWDAMSSYAEVWNMAFREKRLDITIDEDMLKAGMGNTIDEILVMLSAHYGKSMTLDSLFLSRVYEIEDNLMPKIGGKPYSGMQEGIKRLSQKYKIFLLSNCGAKGLPNFMKYTGIEDYITDFVSYGIRPYSKAENLAYMADKHLLKNPVYIGDTQSDCNNAHKAGMPFVFASYGFGECTDYDMKVGSFQEIVKFFMQE